MFRQISIYKVNKLAIAHNKILNKFCATNDNAADNIISRQLYHSALYRRSNVNQLRRIYHNQSTWGLILSNVKWIVLPRNKCDLPSQCFHKRTWHCYTMKSRRLWRRIWPSTYWITGNHLVYIWLCFDKLHAINITCNRKYSRHIGRKYHAFMRNANDTNNHGQSLWNNLHNLINMAFPNALSCLIKILMYMSQNYERKQIISRKQKRLNYCDLKNI